MTARILRSIHEVSATDWNALDLCGQPFLRHEFLAALEDTGCVCAATGWIPHHLILLNPQGSLAAAMPLYLKTHSMGEFVFDFSWAEFYNHHFSNSGRSYYPKLVSAIPFTPATGPRALLAKHTDSQLLRGELIETLKLITEELKLSSTHVLFPHAEDLNTLDASGWLIRTQCQFHWFNRKYQSMDDFLASFRADKRKKARRERRRVLDEFGIQFRTLNGDELDEALWKKVFSFSQSTFHQHGHEHYLTPEFFHRVAQALPTQVMVKLAEYRGEAVAAAIFFVSDNTLFGRYWGADQRFDSLHFETCYYQGIEFCIEKGIQIFEPGTQGEHKIARGFEPSLTYSAHHVNNADFHRVLSEHLIRERSATDHYAAELTAHIPFHRQAHSEPQ